MNLATDILLFARLAKRTPRITLPAFIALSLGISGVTVVYGAFQRLLAQAVPFPRADQLVLVGAPNPPDGHALRWWGQNPAFEALATYRSGGIDASGGDQENQLMGAVVSASFFRVVGITPALGRPFLESEEHAGAAHAVVISDSLSAKMFGSARAALTRELILNGEPYTIVGVMPQGFQFPGQTQLWVPRSAGGAGAIRTGSDTQPGIPPAAMIGRLKVGQTLEAAQKGQDLLLGRLRAAFKGSRIHFGISAPLRPLRDALVANARPSLIALFGAASLTLLIAVMDAANLLLSWVVERRKEAAIRSALGASPRSLILQAFAESTLLTLSAGGAGCLLAFWGGRFLKLVTRFQIPPSTEVGLNLKILLFAFLVSILIGILVGILRGMDVTKLDFASAIRDDSPAGSGKTMTRPRRLFVIGQVALSVALVNTAALMGLSLRRLGQVTLGFDPKNLLLTEVNASSAIDSSVHSNGRSSVESVMQTQAAIIARLERTPGVAAAGFVSNLPLSGGPAGYLWLDVGGKVAASAAQYLCISGKYFEAMGITLHSGRIFTPADYVSGAPVVIINQTLAHQYWRGKSPIGDQLLIEGEGEGRRIVGVVGNIKQSTLRDQPEPQIYVPWSQPYRGNVVPNMGLAIRLNSMAGGAAGVIRKQIRLADGGLPMSGITSMDEILDGLMQSPQLRTILLASFGGLALILGSLGVYGMVSLNATSRQHEIGVRFALGARRGDILELILSDAIRLTLAGLIIGALVATALARYMSSLFYGVRTTNPAFLAFSALLICATAVAASLVPAARASRMDAMRLLKYE